MSDPMMVHTSDDAVCAQPTDWKQRYGPVLGPLVEARMGIRFALDQQHERYGSCTHQEPPAEQMLQTALEGLLAILDYLIQSSSSQDETGQR